MEAPIEPVTYSFPAVALRPIGGDLLVVVVCDECGAVVSTSSTDAHSAWHRRTEAG